MSTNLTRALCISVLVATEATASAGDTGHPRDDAFAFRFEHWSETLSCWESAGFPRPLDLIAQAAGGDIVALRQVVSVLAMPTCDGAGSEGQAALIGDLLTHVGDRDFARSLEGLTMAQLDAVAGTIDGAIGDEDCTLWAHSGIARQFPRTWIALGGNAYPGSDRPDYEPLLPMGELPQPVINAEEAWLGELQIDTCRSMPASIELTTKGNGVLSIGNLVVRVYDEHDDGSVFYGGLASIERGVIRNKLTLVVRAIRVYTTNDEFNLGTQMPVEVVATYHDGRFEVEHDPFGLVLQK